MSRTSGIPSQEPPETTPPLGAAGADVGACAGGCSPPPPLSLEPPTAPPPELFEPLPLEGFELPPDAECLPTAALVDLVLWPRVRP